MSLPDTLGGYAVTEKLYERKGAVEYRAIRAADQVPVILRVLDPRRCRPGDVERLKNEYELERALDTPAAVRPLAFEIHEGLPVLVTEDFAGEPLGRPLEPIPLGRFLPLAVNMVAAVKEIHARGIVHRDLRPENFLVDASGSEVRITNFGSASRLPREEMALRSSAQLIEGSLPYMSPEQTGRMNRPVDRRSDLYSLGVTLYQMLTGRLPFKADDLLGWVHSHMARVPTPPAATSPSAAVVGRITLKLLEKIPEDRYQSAAGLVHDLRRCWAQWQKCGRIDPFDLDLSNSDRLTIPHKLYGREREAAVLLSAFDRVVATGTPEVVLISGPPGVGKSSLVQALQAPVARGRGFFVSGKYEREKRDIPFVAKPIKQLVLEVLAEGPDRIAEWRALVQSCLGSNGRAIVDILPELEWLIGPQPPIPQLPPNEAENRLQFAVRSLAGAFARREHPLTIFLDDMQWADAASLRMLQYLISYPDTRYLLVIGAYRDNEVSATHPLARAFEASRNAGVAVTDLSLSPLSIAQVGQMVGDSVRCLPETVAALGGLVHGKTDGNPFFTVQFLTELERRDLVAFDRSTGHWRWDLARIASAGFTDDVVHLMGARLETLPPATREVVELCACIGDVSQVSLLAEVWGRSLTETEAALRPALEDDLLVGSDRTVRFSHDRVLEAAYARVPEADRAVVHLRIGRAIQARTPRHRLEENIFPIVNQLDRGAALVTAPEERDALAELNLLAGNRARASGAYASGAPYYYSLGVALLDDDGWQRRPDLAFALELGRAECEYLIGNRDGAERALTNLSRRATHEAQRAAAARVKIHLHVTASQPERAIEAGMEALHRFDIELAAHPSRQGVVREYDRMSQSLGGRRIEELFDLPIMTDPVWRGAMEVLQAMLVPALFTDLNLYGLIACHMAQISVRHGNTDASCYAYVTLGGLIGPVLGDYPRGMRFGQLGLALSERQELYRYRSHVHAAFGTLVSIWAQHVKADVDFQAMAFEQAVQDGALNAACYAACLRISALMFAGAPLDEVLRQTEKALEFVRRAGFELAAAVAVAQQRLVLVLQGRTDALGTLNNAGFDEGQFESRLAAGGPSLALPACWYFARKLQARVMASDWAGALEAASRAKELLWTSMVFLERVEIAFYEALAIAGRHDEAPPEEKWKCRRMLAEHQEQLAIWAKNCPENFRDRYALVSAEIARIDADPQRASDLYEQAIRAAKESGFVHSEGLAYERASQFYRGRSFGFIADTYLREAHACYRRWGAEGKVREIDRLHRRLLPSPPVGQTTADAVGAEQIDLLSVLRASQTISREIDSDTLLRTLLEVVLEQGGARTARLVRVRGDDLTLEAEATSDGVDGEAVRTQLLGSTPVSASSPLPRSILRYVQRTRERVLLDDARADAGKFGGDEYLARAKPRSLLCQPVLRQDRAIALLVLENDLVPSAFTGRRLGALALLATQAAISIENARLVEERQRTESEARFVAEASKALATSLDYDSTLAQVARLAVPRFADWCMVDVLEDGRLRRVTGAHADPTKADLIKELVSQAPILGSSHPVARALATRAPYIVVEATDESILLHSPDARHAAIVGELGCRSFMSVPLITHAHPVGVITFASALSFYYGPAVSAMTEELAQRAATAIENARLYREAQDSILARDVFLSLASHELRTPVTSLVLTAHRLRTGLLESSPENIRHVVLVFERQLGRLRTLIDDMMGVGQMLLGRLAVTAAPMDLAALVREEVRRAAPIFESANCALTLHAHQPVRGCWDHPSVAQIVRKLLANALKFGAGAPIEIVVDRIGGSARLVVIDHGIGIEAAMLPHIFQRFERGVSSDLYGGLGIGLYIVQHIVQALGGTVRAESTPCVETRFTVELPTGLAG